jgi:acyl-CoA thioester hydrolase
VQYQHLVDLARSNEITRSLDHWITVELARVTAFTHPVRIYWEDTDAGGIVYYANYLKFMERARTEWLRTLDVEQETLMSEQGLMFVVVHADVAFRKPARYGDSLQVSCELAERSRASMTFRQQVLREGTNELLVEGLVKIACLDAVKLKPRGLPDLISNKMGGGVS